MTLQQSLSIIIKHHIPGRLRLLFSHYPKDSNRLQTEVTNHPGVIDIRYSPVTRSLLLQFDPKTVTFQELLIRVAMRFSVDYDLIPVQIQTQSKKHELSESAYYSGVALSVALFSTLSRINGSAPALLNKGASVATALAVVDHGWTEFKERGNFDPEVVSFAYLVNSMLRGNYLSAACLTWIAAFGRHLVWPTTETIELKPNQLSHPGGDSPQFEITIRHDEQSNRNIQAFGRFLRTALGAFLTDHPGQRQTLLGQIREISDAHGEVFEGLSDLNLGVPVHFR